MINNTSRILLGQSILQSELIQLWQTDKEKSNSLLESLGWYNEDNLDLSQRRSRRLSVARKRGGDSCVLDDQLIREILLLYAHHRSCRV